MTIIEIYLNAELVKRYSTRNVMIEQVETGKQYSEMIGLINDGCHYVETDIPINQNEGKKEVEK